MLKVSASPSASAGPAEKCPAKRLPGAARQNLAIRLLGGTQPATELAATNGVSRKFLYQQARKAETALDAAFVRKDDASEVLFHLPVTAEWLDQFILGQVLICHASFRGVKEIMRDMFGVPISIGSVHNVVMEAVERSRALNAAERLANVKVGAHDEIFQARQPVLVGADVDSTYCYLLSAETARDGDTWALRLMELSDKNLRPDYTVADGGTGLRAGQTLAWPSVPCRGDVFHALLEMGRLAVYLEHRAFGAMSALENTAAKMTRAKRNGKGNKFSKRLTMAVQTEREAIELSDDISTLAEWLRRDILSLAGDDFNSRRELMDFVIEALGQREYLRPHRIRPVRVMLENQRDLLLAFAEETDGQLSSLAHELGATLADLRQLFNLRAHERTSGTSAGRDQSLREQLGKIFDPADQAVHEIANSVVRASSVIENLNSRLRCYFFLRRQIGPGYLDLLRFFLNHRRFMRSEHPERVDKSPSELLSGESHPHWLELLGFEMFKRAA
ncbi:MAG: hypothetical protein L6455_10250 [Kiritimatiellae bacterium]|nr:hypothetical protein [Kiritimatiellia bacterium]